MPDELPVLPAVCVETLGGPLKLPPVSGLLTAAGTTGRGVGSARVTFRGPALPVDAVVLPVDTVAAAATVPLVGGVGTAAMIAETSAALVVAAVALVMVGVAVGRAALTALIDHWQTEFTSSVKIPAWLYCWEPCWVIPTTLTLGGS
jgi:hypothetical protein